MCPRLRIFAIGAGLIVAAAIGCKPRRAATEHSSPPPGSVAATASASSQPPAPPPPLLKDGKVLFKVVLVGYSGVCTALKDELARLPAGARETWQLTEDSGWTFCSIDYDVAGKRWQDRPVHLHVFGHEGLGFIGQPGTAKDVVYKNAHAVFALARIDEASDLSGVLEVDLTRLHAHGTWPVAGLVVNRLVDLQSLLSELPDRLLTKSRR
jgi:hypothetical protein